MTLRDDTRYGNLDALAQEVGEHSGAAGSLNSRVTTLEGGGGGTGAQEPIWEWNGTDTSQFEGSDAFASASCSMALSTPANADVIGGKVLRVAGTVDAGGIAVRLLTQTFPFVSARRALRFEIDLLVTDAQYVGIAIIADNSGANLFSYNYYLIGTAGTSDRVDDGTLVTDGTTPYQSIQATYHGRAVIRVAADKVTATRPRFRVSGLLSPQGAAFFAPFNIEAKHTEWFSEPAAAGWTGLACDRVGLVVRGTAAAGDLVCDIEAIRIFEE